MASLSAAGFLQHMLPQMRIDGFPLAGLIGLLCGWMLAVPVTRWTARRLDPAGLGQVFAVAIVSGLVWATPAAIYAPAIGWMGGALRVYLVAGMLSASGLIWGGYLDCDRLLDE